MIKRREFSRAVRVQAIKRATTVTGQVFCQICGALCRSFEVDHIIADSHGGEPTLENARIVCQSCHAEKSSKDTTTAAKIKRVEAKHLGATKPKAEIKSRGFDRKQRTPKPSLPPREIYTNAVD